MRRWHLYGGLLFVAVFLATGAKMRASFPEAHSGDAGVRMMYRSAHVYILLSALGNVLVGVHARVEAARPRLRAAGSFLLLAAPLAFTASFFLEPAPMRFARPLALAGAILALAGTALHLIASRRRA